MSGILKISMNKNNTYDRFLNIFTINMNFEIKKGPSQDEIVPFMINYMFF